MAESLLVVTCMFPDRETAERVVRVLVEERWIACGNCLDGAQSLYWWQGAIEQAAECKAMMKTVPRLWEGLCERLRVLHPYEVPEIIGSAPSVVDASYLRWVMESVRA